MVGSVRFLATVCLRILPDEGAAKSLDEAASADALALDGQGVAELLDSQDRERRE